MKRGRLKSVDLLPAKADKARERAIDAILSRYGTQLDVLARLNDDLKALGLAPVSHSAFNRWVTDGLKNGFVRRGATAPVAERCPTCGAVVTDASKLTARFRLGRRRQ